jgi:hypothetical protein
VLTGHVVDIEPSFGNGGIGVVELGRKRLDLADSPVKRADGTGLAALSDPTWLSLICKEGQLARLGRQRLVDDAE